MYFIYRYMINMAKFVSGLTAISGLLYITFLYPLQVLVGMSLIFIGILTLAETYLND